MKIRSMKSSFAISAVLPALALATTASATVYVPGSPNFSLTTPPGYTIYNSPVINGFLGVTPYGAGTFTDDFEFTIPQRGSGSGSVTTTANMVNSSNYIEFLSISFDGVNIPIVTTMQPNGGVQQTAALTGLPILTNFMNDLKITYSSQGAGSYGGQLTFETGSVPEPTTWASFVLGLGIAGFALRRKLHEQALDGLRVSV